MPKEPSEEDIIQLARVLVDSWEQMPGRIDAFCKEFGEQYREPLTKDMHSIYGGETLYKLSKELVEKVDAQKKREEQLAEEWQQIDPGKGNDDA